MRKTIFIIILAVTNLNCSSTIKAIDRAVDKIEKDVDRCPYFAENVCWDCFPEMDAVIYYTEIENQIKKINFEISSDDNCKEYSKKSTIYLKNNVPILITETEKGICEFEMSGVDQKTKKFQSFKQENKIRSDVKIYIEDWQKFEITVVGASKPDLDLRTEEIYRKIVDGILKPEKLK